MAGPYTSGNLELLTTNFNTQVHNILMAKQVLKQSVLVQPSSSGIERIYMESEGELDANAQIPRGAEFTSDQLIYNDTDIRPRKYGGESRVDWEDFRLAGPNLPMRTTVRLANRVARLVDTRIYNVLSDSQSAATIWTLAAAATWDNATRASRIPHEDIAEAISVIMTPVLQAYVPDSLFINAKQYCFLRTNDYVMSSWDASGPNLMQNGVMGQILGLTTIVNPVVAADSCVVADAKRAVTWFDVETKSGIDVGPSEKFYSYFAFQFGNAALTDPHASLLITNTDA